MKHTFNAYFIVMLLLLAPACQRIAEQDVQQEKPAHVLTAVLEGEPETKTTLSNPDEKGIYYPYWSVGDAVALYADGINQADTYSLVSGAGTGRGTFSGTLFGSRMVALYPVADKTQEGLKDNILTIELPAKQKYTPGSFGKDAFPMLSVSTSSELTFRNLCSVLKVSMTGEESVRSIKFISADSWMPVSGKATVLADFNPEPQLTMADDGSTEVTLDCGCVELNPATPTDFFLVIPPGTYHGGFTLEIQTFNGMVTRSTSKDVTFGRSQFRSIPAFECVGSGEVDPDSVPYNQIWYKTSDGNKLQFWENPFDVEIVSHDYMDGLGVIKCSGPITRIESRGFNGYWNLEEIHLPDCVEEIGEYAFGYTGITAFRTPEHLTSVKDFAFTYSHSLSRFYGRWASEDGRFIVLEGGVLCANAPAGMSETITLPDNTVSVASFVFLDDRVIHHLIIPEGVEIIGDGVFNFGEVLETVTLPASLSTFSMSAFTRCPNLRAFYGDSRFIREGGTLLVNDSGSLIRFVGKDVVDYEIPEGVTMLCNGAFQGLPNLRSITFPSTLSSLYTGWIYDCPNVEFFYGSQTTDDHHCLVFSGYDLVTVTPVCPAIYDIPRDAGITQIFVDALARITTIEHLTIPDEVTVARGCFNEMTNLKSLRLSSSLQALGDNPFYGDLALEELYLRSFTPPSFSDGDDEWFKWGADNLVIYVPEGFETLYKQASGWSKYADRIQGYVYDDLETPDYYISSDYSRNGEVNILQKATEGEGIELVLMGDGYSDRQIADGTYDAAMQKMMDAFFSVEPYSTYKNLFNVSAITVVSSTEGYDHAGQALGTWFGEGTLVGGDDVGCMNFARAVVPEEKMDKTVIVVAMNRDYYAGTCYMYYPSSGDYGLGTSVAYFPTSSDTDTYNGLVRHEAGGHGFAKLADEYAYDQAITESAKAAMEANFRYGWSKNIDFTNDPARVKWAHFLQDDRYRYDGLGVFEGGATYTTGVWRPTDDSIMRYNQGAFNAPSREAIWYRIHKLAYGDNWAYDYEDFVAYDVKNRKTGAESASVQAKSYVERPDEPTHPPVVVHQTWKEAMQKGRMSKPGTTPTPRVMEPQWDPSVPVMITDFR